MIFRPILAVIPARGGSKGLLGKNLAPLAGLPLIAYTIRAALDARTIGRTVVSTDDPDIARAALDLGAEVPVMRPPELAGDEAFLGDVIEHMVGHLERTEGVTWETVVTLLPTNPLRTGTLVDAAVERFFELGADTLNTVSRVMDHPGRCLTLQADGRLSPYVPGADTNGQVFLSNGAVAVAKRWVYRRLAGTGSRVLEGVKWRGLEIDPENGLDINTPLDLFMAECLLEFEQKGEKLEL